jgi:hypothetical protein
MVPSTARKVVYAPRLMATWRAGGSLLRDSDRNDVSVGGFCDAEPEGATSVGGVFLSRAVGSVRAVAAPACVRRAPNVVTSKLTTVDWTWRSDVEMSISADAWRAMPFVPALKCNGS